MLLVSSAIAIVCCWFMFVRPEQARAFFDVPAPQSAAQFAGIADNAELDYAAALKELQTSLTFQGDPINPRAIAALTPWLSDTLPGAIAVDIEGTTADTNQFWGEVTQTDGRIFAEWTQSDVSRFVGYQPIGQLENDVHVLRMWINTGGSGVFPSLMLVSFSLDTEIDNGVVRDRLIMTRKGELILGSGYAGDITISGNAITLTPAPNGHSSQTIQVN